MQVTVVTPIPTPYRDPFWEEFSSRPGVNLSVIYCSAGRSDRPWGERSDYSFRRLFPPAQNLLRWAGPGASCYRNTGLHRILQEIKPDTVLVGGYNHLTMLNTVKYCRHRAIPWLLMCETWKQRGGLTGAVKHTWLRRWLSRAAGAIPTGRLASEYLKRLGVPAARQCLLPNVPDISSLRAASDRMRTNRAQTREALGLSGDSPVVLFAARMIEKKRPLLVLNAFHRIAATTDAVLVMLGDGPLRRSVEQLAGERGLSARTVFPGFVAPDVAHQWMSVADVFVQPSSETWGVAPIEALVCGCRLVLSSEIGCHADIMESEGDGVVLRTVDEASLSAAIVRMLNRDGSHQDRPDGASSWLDSNRYADLACRLDLFLRQLKETGPHGHGGT